MDGTGLVSFEVDNTVRGLIARDICLENFPSLKQNPEVNFQNLTFELELTEI